MGREGQERKEKEGTRLFQASCMYRHCCFVSQTGRVLALCLPPSSHVSRHSKFCMPVFILFVCVCDSGGMHGGMRHV